MHDPATVAFDIKSPFKSKPSRVWPKGYRNTWFTIWHIDPEKPGTGNRSDDSCGWFDRRPGQYADAVAYFKADQTFMHDVRLSLARREPMPYPFYEGISERHMTGLRLPAGEALALVTMVAQELELRRWWNGQDGNGGAHASFWRRHLTRRHDVMAEAASLALHPLDNMSAIDEPEAVVGLIAAALNRRAKPWWRHPRWHVHHWRIQWHWLQTFNRWAFARCAKCGGRFRWGESPTGSWGGDEIWHSNGCGAERAVGGQAAVERDQSPA